MSIKEEYRKERRRVLALLRRYKRAGYEVTISAPNIPKRITQGSINVLKKITANKVKESSYAEHPKTKERVTAKVVQAYKRLHRPKTQRREKREVKTYAPPIGSYEDAVISAFLESVDNMLFESLKVIARVWLEKVLSENDITTVADGLEKAKRNNLWRDLEEAYKEVQVLDILSQITVFFDISAEEKKDIMKDFFERTDFYDEYYQ